MNVLNTGWTQAESSVGFQEYQDNWIRTFRASEIPKLQDNEKEMLDEWLRGKEIFKILTYFGEYKGLDEELSEFMIREMVRGNV